MEALQIYSLLVYFMQGNAFCEVQMKERPKKKKKSLVSCWYRRKINSLKENFLENKDPFGAAVLPPRSCPNGS